MKFLLTILLSILCNITIAQHIVISGGVYNADNMRISVYHAGKTISQQEVQGRVYTIFLGEHQYYEIQFESNDRIKIMHFFCYNLKNPTSIVQDIHFNNQTNVIIWYWNNDGKNKQKIERTFWGPHAAWKDNF